MTTPLFTYVTKTPKQIHDDFLRTVKNGLVQRGILSPNVALSGDYDVLGTALSLEAAVSQANATILADQHMPDTASGALIGAATIGYLDRWGSLVSGGTSNGGITRRPPVGSHGLINTQCSVSSTIVATGSQLKDTSGNRCQVTVGGTFTASNGVISGIPVQMIDVGSSTNHNNGDTLTWIGSAPPFCSQNAACGTPNGTDGLTGGFDGEPFPTGDESYRQRILAALANPPKGGNWLAVSQLALASSPLVNIACVYPALNGPGTVYVAVSAAVQQTPPFTSTSKSRIISATTVANVVLPYIQGQLSEHAFIFCLSTVDQPVDIAILLGLPAAPTASPPGPGGGWLDGQPWPSSISGTTPVTVTAVTSSTNITVNATTTPVAGSSRIAWISPLNWTLYTATVVSFSGSSGAYVLTLDTPMPGIANGNYIFPQSQNQQVYLTTLLNAISQMGPGEWTSNAGILGRGFRHPVPSIANPYSLTPVQLKQIISSGSEVLNATYLFTSATTPTVPGSITVGPNVFVPRNLAWYAV